jgi:hypothetical protein
VKEAADDAAADILSVALAAASLIPFRALPRPKPFFADIVAAVHWTVVQRDNAGDDG